MSRSTSPAAVELPAELAKRWRGAFRDLRSEHGFSPLRVEGEIPAELDGTLFRNGPGLLTRFGRRYGHLFDGDGAVVAVRLSQGAASGAVRVVQTPHLLAEREAGEPLFGSYGTPAPHSAAARRGTVRNPANGSVLLWQGRLFALADGARPIEMSPMDLTTVGETGLETAQVRTFSSHPRAVPERQAVFNFGVRWGLRPAVEIFALPEFQPARRIGEVHIGRNSLIHDFAATANHLLFLVPPLKLPLLPTALGRGTLSANFEWRPALGTQVVVVPLDDPRDAVSFETEPFFQWHFANAFEARGRLCVDLVQYSDFTTNRSARDLPGGRIGEDLLGKLCRATIDLRRLQLTARPLWTGNCEFPQVSPAYAGRQHRFVYAVAQSPSAAACRNPSDQLVKIDVETGDAEAIRFTAHQLPSEPIFVPRPGATLEDDGFLLSLVYDGLRDVSCLAIFYARALGAGPVACAWFDHPVPFTFHGTWQPTPA